MMNIKIYVCCHKECPTLETECIKPIHAGRALSKIDLDFIGDDTGDNISTKNPNWCELTVLYWMWKNVKADYYGLFHYRRYLSFTNTAGIFKKFDQENIERYGWSDEYIKEQCERYDIITAPSWNIHPVGTPWNVMTSYDFYAREHYKKDLDEIIHIIRTQTPDLYPYAIKALYSRQMFFANMMIMKSKFFGEYMEWLFKVLFEAEKIIDISNYDSYQKRIWGFLAERLANCYLLYAIDKYKDLRVRQLEMAFGYFDDYSVNAPDVFRNIELQKIEAQKKIIDDSIQVALCIDNAYVPHCAVTVLSILENINLKQHLRIFIIHDGSITADNKEKLRMLAKEYEHVEIIFIAIDKSEFYLYPNNRAHISIATYFRLKIHRFLPADVHKVIYLDSDVVVCDNIGELWKIALGDNLLAATYDEGGVSQQRRLCLPVSHNYFNAGILVMNVDVMRRENIEIAFMENFYKYQDYVTLQDQDILNITAVGRCVLFDLRWNANGRLYEFNDLERKYDKEMAMQAAYHPGIIHFTDRKKPWKELLCEHPLKELYFIYLEKTPWRSAAVRRTIVFRAKKILKSMLRHIHIKILDNDRFSIRLLGMTVVLRKRYFRWLKRLFFE